MLFENPRSSPYNHQATDTRNNTTYTLATYTYEAANGDLLSSTDGITGITTTYEYDLIRRPLAVSSSDGLKQWVGYNTVENKTAVYTYDTGGNITSITYYPYTLSSPSGSTGSLTYTYNNANLKDLLTGVSATGTTPAYDAIGNPTSWRSSMSMSWVRGRRLSTITAPGQAYSYTYDAWGRPLSTTGSQAGTIGVQNPLRYRGYYYDTETGFYYLNSRHYDPVVGRFVNADGHISDVGGNVVGNNMFAYCFNNPVNLVDQLGNWPSWAAKVVISIAVVVIITCIVVLATSLIAPAAVVGAAITGALCGGGLTGVVNIGAQCVLRDLIILTSMRLEK